MSMFDGRSLAVVASMQSRLPTGVKPAGGVVVPDVWYCFNCGDAWPEDGIPQADWKCSCD